MYTSICRVLENKYMFPPILSSSHSKDRVLHIKEKFDKIEKFNGAELLERFPSVSIINISDYLSKVTDVLNKVFIAVSIISTITVIVGLVVISSAIIVAVSGVRKRAPMLAAIPATRQTE